VRPAQLPLLPQDLSRVPHGQSLRRHPAASVMEARGGLGTVQRRYARLARASVKARTLPGGGTPGPPCSRWPIRAFTMADPGVHDARSRRS
jgi:hypothetical protein